MDLQLPGKIWVDMVGALAAAVVLPGCATQTITASLPTVVAAAGEPTRIDASTTEVYGRIAAGAMRCWFANYGQIKKSHIFHADADPLAKGGGVEVAVLERDLAGPKPWGAKAFKVLLAPSGEQTSIAVENLKMPEPMATPMRDDVFDWAQGGTGCRLKPSEPPSPAAEVPAKKKKPKAKVQAAAR